MGSHCLQPFPTLMWMEMLPFGMVTLLKLCMRVAIQFIIVSQKPIKFNGGGDKVEGDAIKGFVKVQLKHEA